MATRREKVILELEDNFTTGMARAAAATALLDKNLNGLSGDSVKSARVEFDRTAVSANSAADGIDRTGISARRTGAEIDRMSGRLRLATDAILTLGTAVVPIGAAAVPALFALTAGFGAVAGAAGVALVAFNGVGDALKALDAYQLQPTEKNLLKMRSEFEKLGPAGAAFAHYLDELEPELRSLQNLTRAGFLPGVAAGLSSLLTMLPEVRTLLFGLATAFGAVTASAGAALAGDGFAGFFDYLGAEAGPLLMTFAHTLGNVAQGFASMIVAFGPLTGSFAAGMERMSQSFANWAAGLSETDGFRGFVAYVRETGPEVVALLGAMGTAFVAIMQAAAPVGAAVLPALTALAKVLGTIAASPIGTPLFTAAAALLALNRAAVLASAGFNRLKVSATGANLAAAKFGAGVSFAAIISGIGLVDAAFNKLGDSINETDLSRNLEALARGEIVEDLENIGKHVEQASASWNHFTDGMSDVLTLGFDTSALESSQQEIEKVDQALAALVEGGQAEIAASAFAAISEQALAAGASTEDVAASFDAYNLALDNAAPTAEEAAEAQAKLAAATDSAGRVAKITRTQVEGLTAAMEEQVSAALGAFDAVTQYGRALDEAQKRAKKSDAGLDASTEAGRKNRDALSQLAAAWNSQGDAIRNNMAKWREARKSFIDTAVAMGAPIEKARDLADRLLAIPKQRQIDIKLYGSERAADQIARIRREIQSVPTEWRTRFYVTQVNSVNRGFSPESGLNRAGGGPIVGPGTKTSDSVPVLASNGEFMMSAAAVDHYGLGTMFAMNARRLASGGPVASVGAGGTPFMPDLSIGAVASMLKGLGHLGEREIRRREKHLARMERLAEKELEQAQDRLDEEREHLRALRDARRDFEQAVSSNFRSQLFGDVDLFEALRSGQLPSEIMAAVRAFAAGDASLSGASIEDQVRAYLASLSASELAALQVQASGGALGQDAREAERFADLLDQLQALGLNGGLFRQLAASGNIAQAQYLATLTPEQIAQFEQDFRERNRANRRLEGVAGSDFGPAIRRQTRATERAVEYAREQRDELRAIKAAQNRIEKELAHIKNESPKKTGDAVGAAINGASSTSVRRSR